MISKIERRLQKRDERGALLMEYGLVLMLVVFAALVTLTVFGVSVIELYDNSAGRFTGAVQESLGTTSATTR